MRRTWKSFLSLLLAFAMILSLGVTGFAQGTEPEETGAEETGGTVAALPFEKVDNDVIPERFPFANELEEVEDPLYADEDVVRVSIVLDGLSAIDAGYLPSNAGLYRAGLKAEQETVASRISTQALGGDQLDVVWNLTLACNIISANVPYGSIEDIKAVPGVRDVVLEIRYYPTEDETVDPENIIATEMTGATKAWNLGYTGAGSKIAVVDTGLDTDHQSFDAAAFEHAIDELNEGRETPIKLMTAEDVAAVWDQLNAAKFISSVDGVYLTSKVPFAVNYIDRDLDVTHDNDTQGEHGSHVAGIAAANKYIPGEDGFVNALETVQTQGEAPDAQLLIMKVFGKGGGAYDSDYMIAVEDAMTLGCDAVNLSLGSSVAGYTTNATYAAILDKLLSFGLVWANSAGNNYSWTNFATGPNNLYYDDVNYQTGGSPATYNNTLSVASVDNTTGSLAVPLALPDGTKITFSETSGYGNDPIGSIPGEYTFIMLLPNQSGGSNGDEEAQFGALGSEILEGKVAIAWRGGSSFYVKANAAVSNGAIATIVANNQAGVINMNLTGYEYSAPAVSILQNDGYRIANSGALKQANGVNYIEGTIIIPEGIANNTASVFQEMSDFSSWGGNGALTMKPEITAPGGNIWSVNGAVAGGKAYEYMSGTSMASPQVAGLVAVMKQYIRETGLQEKLGGLSERAITQSLLMSTSVPLREAATGYYWSIMKQGSGLADVNGAITARSFIKVVSVPESAPASAAASIADGKVKVELGEIGDSFATTFTVTNFSDESMSLDFNGEFFTQLVSESFRTEYTTPIYAGIGWTVNGEPYSALSLSYDFNGDHVTNGLDAQHLLNWCADESIEVFNFANADFDKDGNVDTNDARIAFEELNSASIKLAAHETATVTVNVSYDLSAYKAINGTYVEGFLFVNEGETSDGALGVTHSIPVFGFYGNYTDASMFDRGSYLEYNYGFGDGDPEYGVAPYMTASTALGDNAYVVETYIVQRPDGTYYFGGNPIVADDEYMPERNALSENDVLAGVRYTQIRNAGASRFYVTEATYGLLYQAVGGPSYAAYYYASQGAWQNTNTTSSLNLSLQGLPEGLDLTAHFQLAPEYYVNSDGSVRWDELGEGTELTASFTMDNTAPEILGVVHETLVPPTPDEDETPTVGGEELDNLILTVKDNQYIAAVVLYDDQGNLLSYQGSDAKAEAGAENTYAFDLLKIFGDEEVYPYLLVEVYDYAANLTTYKINFKDDLTTAEVESVTVDPAEATIIGTGSLQLTVDVRPWGIDDSVTWTSSDETVATVDANGVVTGVAEGTATITAASVLKPEITGTCEITVMFVDKDLSGIVWDENGEVWFSDFNLSTIPAYDKLNEESLRTRVCTTALDVDGLYAATFDSNENTSLLCTVDTTDWSVTPVGDESEIGFMDICAAPHAGTDLMLGVSGKYLLLIDKTTGQYSGAFNTGAEANLVGIAYEGSVDWSAYGYGILDFFFLVDVNGNVYEGAILNQDEMSGYWLRPSKFGNVGFTCDTPYWQSLYFDGEALYWSCFNEGDNMVKIVMGLIGYNEDSDAVLGDVYNVGRFADGVWPVGGLFERTVTSNVVPAARTAVSAERVTANDFLAVIPGTETVEEPVDDDYMPIGTIAPVTGGLDSAPVPDAEIEKIDPAVIIPITAEELTRNGKIVIDYDPSTIKLISAVSPAQYKGILDQTAELGHYVLAWVDQDGIDAEDVILTLKFSTNSKGVVTITTYEVNERDADADENLPHEDLVFLGTDDVEPHDHVYKLDHWTWADDCSTATATFACEVCGATRSYSATVTSKEVEATCLKPFTTVYTATVEVEGETYTDVKEVTEGELADHVYGEPTWTWAEDNSTATATFVCGVCDDEQVIDAEITEEVITAAEPHVAGEAKLTATVVFEEKTYTDVKTVEIPALPCPCEAFEDMPPYGTPEHEAIDWAFTHNPPITTGMDATHFGTGMTLTRAQTAVFLYAAAGKPDFDVNTAQNSFSDVPAGQWFTKPVLWAASQGLVKGYEDGTFKPNDTLTRAQIIVILYAWAGKPAPTIDNPYSDCEGWYANAAIWAYEKGIEKGTDGAFGGSTPCTRESFVLYLYRYMTGNRLAE